MQPSLHASGASGRSSSGCRSFAGATAQGVRTGAPAAKKALTWEPRPAPACRPSLYPLTLPNARRFRGVGGLQAAFCAFALARNSGLGRRLLTVALRMDAELMPVGFGKIDLVVSRGLLDVRES